MSVHVTTEPIHGASPTRHRIGDRHRVFSDGECVGFVHREPKDGWTVYRRDASGGFDVHVKGCPGSLADVARVTAGEAFAVRGTPVVPPG